CALLLPWLASAVEATEVADEEDIATPVVIAPAAEASTDAEPASETGWQDMQLLGSTVPVGEFRTLYWSPEQSFQSIDTPVPVLIAHGRQAGPRLCLTAAIHGDELNGIEMVRRLMYQLDPATMSGTVIGIPIVNLDGFRRGSRYLADR